VKLRDLLPICLLAPVIGFVIVQAAESPTTARTDAASIAQPAPREARGGVERASPISPSTTSRDRAPAGPSGTATDASEPRPAATENTSVVSSAVGADVIKHDAGDVRRRIMLGGQGTYIDEILLQRDSALARWPERVATPIRVWIATAPSLPGWDSEFPDRVRDAFSTWSGLGIPVKFTFVRDSADADVHVTWVDHFDTQISGKTLWARDRNWWIVNANITLALHHNGGEALDNRAIRAIALHEVGHLLGLDHTADTTNIMTAKVRVRDISNADRATIKLLYMLPPGSVKG